MYESTGSQFFRTTNVIQSRRDAFDKSRFVMIFLTILQNPEILCSFRLDPEGKASKKSEFSFNKIRVVRKVFSKQFSFIRCRRQHLPDH